MRTLDSSDPLQQPLVSVADMLTTITRCASCKRHFSAQSKPQAPKLQYSQCVKAKLGDPVVSSATLRTTPWAHDIQERKRIVTLSSSAIQASETSSTTSDNFFQWLNLEHGVLPQEPMVRDISNRNPHLHV